MIDVLGQILPLALGIAVSPIPIIAAILMLLAPHARLTSVGFLLGWAGGVLISVTIFTLLAGFLPHHDPGESRPIQGTIRIVLGLILLGLAFSQWRKRPQPGAEPALPKWMAAIDKTTFPVALGLGLLLSALNPKNLIMAAGAGVDIGAAAIGTSGSIAVIAVFAVIAVSTVLVPVLGFLIAPGRFRTPLDRLRKWLAAENATVMAVLLLVIGVVMVGKGISSF